MTMNNLFDFATKELSQDAVICWCVNWFNDKQSKLYSLAVDLLKLLIDFDEKEENEIAIQQQLFKIDVLLYFKKSGKTVIVEDKVYTSEHGNQIAKYRSQLEKLSDKEKCDYELPKITPEKISTVYFKTGFFYDDDKLVRARVDRIVCGEDFLKVIEKYKDADYILTMYYDYLKRMIGWYGIYGDFTDTKAELFWSWNIVKHQIAQYKLMRELFSESMWDGDSSKYKVYHGSNVGGRPWTEMVILNGHFPQGNEEYNVFWRIDTDSDGPYISLRFYDDYDKNSEKEKQEHISQYQYHRKQVENIVREAEGMWSWDEIMPGKTENYKESTLLHVHIGEILKSWNTEKEVFTRRITTITEDFMMENE